MKFKAKLMYLGKTEINGKDGNKYNIIALMDGDTSTTYKIFGNEEALDKVKDLKLYNFYDFDLSVTKNEKSGLLNLGLI